jgi:hypothetical protein
MTTTRNRVRYWADQRGWDVQEIFRQAVLVNIKIALSTVYRLYGEPDYIGNRTSLEALARVFGLRYTDMIEDVEVPEQSKNSKG